LIRRCQPKKSLSNDVSRAAISPPCNLRRKLYGGKSKKEN
jgi:hypothetical protein